MSIKLSTEDMKALRLRVQSGREYVDIHRSDLASLLDLAAEALNRREVFGLAKLACQRSEQQGAHYYLVELETMEELRAAVAEASR